MYRFFFIKIQIFIYASGSAYLPAKTIAFKSVSRTKNKNGLLMSTFLGRDREALRATNSIEDAAAPTVPSLVTSIVALCLTLPALAEQKSKQTEPKLMSLSLNHLS